MQVGSGHEIETSYRYLFHTRARYQHQARPGRSVLDSLGLIFRFILTAATYIRMAESVVERLTETRILTAKYLREAYYTLRAAGPQHTELQLGIRDLARDALAVLINISSALTIPSTVLTDVQAIRSYLLGGLKEMALEILSDIQPNILAEGIRLGDTSQKARHLSGKVEEMLRRRVITTTIQTINSADRKTANILQNTVVSLKWLAIEWSEVTRFLTKVEQHYESLPKLKETLKEIMAQETEATAHELSDSTTSNSEANKVATKFYDDWVDMNDECTKYVEDIKIIQKDIYEYLRENPTYELAEKSIVDYTL